MNAAVAGVRPAPVPLGEAAKTWARIAALSFGGPAGQIAVMHRILVDEKRWIGEQRFLHALNFCMLLPGPEAQQLATYIGWLLHKRLGGLIAGALFILPGAIAIMALSWIYVLYGNTGVIAGLFLGLKAAVLAIVLQAVIRIGSRALRTGATRLLAIAAFVLIFFLQVPFPVIVLGAAAIGWLAGRGGSRAFAVGAGHGTAGNGVADAETLLGEALPAHARPNWRGVLFDVSLWLALWLLPIAALLAALGPHHVFSQIAIFFAKMAMVTFGGAYAVLAYVAQQAVENYGWLTPPEMLDGLGMAETTPGPLIMVLQFVGFLGAYRDPGMLAPLWAGTLGGLIATWVTFAPCFLWIFLGAPFVERMRGNAALASALSAITAAVVGVILNLALWFAIHAMFRRVTPLGAGPVGFDLPVMSSVDPWIALLTLAAVVAVFRLKLGTFTVLAAAAGAGVVLRLAGLA